MPVLKHAKKKLRQDKKRTLVRKKMERSFKDFVKAARKTKKAADLQKAFQAIDKAAKNHIIHQNKAAHLKSSLSKLVTAKSDKGQVISKTTAKAPAKVKKKPATTKATTSKSAKTAK